jgi:hypothetical protein
MFPAGPPLPEEQQVGRGLAITSVERRLRANEVLLMMEGRRTGKTSVAVAALDRIHAADGRAAAVTLTRFKDDRDVARFLRAELESSPRRAARSLATVLRALDRTPAGELAGSQLSEELAPVAELAASALDVATDLAQLIATAGSSGTTAILLDEAHAMLDWSQSSRSSLNAVLRQQLNVGVVIASSDTEALDRLTERGGPLHLVGSRISLPAITASDWLGALRDRFSELEIAIGEATLQSLIEITRGHPYLTMRFARDIARITSDDHRPWNARPAVFEAVLYELRRDPVWMALSDSAGD